MIFFLILSTILLTILVVVILWNFQLFIRIKDLSEMALKQCAPGLDSVFVTIKAKNVYQQDELLMEITSLLNRLGYSVLTKSNIFYLLPQNQLDYFYDFVMRRKDDIKKSVTKDFGDFIESYSELLENEILEGTPDSNMEEMVRNLLRSLFIWFKLNTELLNNRRIAPESFSRYLRQIILPTNRYIFYAEKGFFLYRMTLSLSPFNFTGKGVSILQQ